jgi:hypothetical protein
MTPEFALALASTSIVATIVSLITRIGFMHRGFTRDRVFYQHFVLVVALIMSLVLPLPWSLVSLAVGIQFFFVMGAPRWRFGAPKDTCKEKT